MFIYKTTNLINKKIYIGQVSVSNKPSTYFGSGTIIKRVVKKYGKCNFIREIIEDKISKSII